MRSGSESLAPCPALPEDLECRDALHAVEEVCAQSAIGGPTPSAAFSAKPEEDSGSHQSEEGEAEENQADRDVNGGNERKNYDRC